MKITLKRVSRTDKEVTYRFNCADKSFGLVISQGILDNYKGILSRTLRPIFRVTKEKIREGIFNPTPLEFHE